MAAPSYIFTNRQICCAATYQSGIKAEKRLLNWEINAEVIITITWDAICDPLNKGKGTARGLQES